jgi:hypothetical protein
MFRFSFGDALPDHFRERVDAIFAVLDVLQFFQGQELRPFTIFSARSSPIWLPIF